MADELKVVSRTQRIIVKSDKSVSIERAGPIGPAGPTGPQGTIQTYRHDQVTPSAVWVVQHNLGITPNPVVYDEDGRTILGWTVSWSNNNVLIITFPDPETGFVLVS